MFRIAVGGLGYVCSIQLSLGEISILMSIGRLSKGVYSLHWKEKIDMLIRVVPTIWSVSSIQWKQGDS